MKLTVVEFIWMVWHHKWLANPVLAPKPNGTLCMCIDFTNLNKACPKDSFHLVRIDQIIDSTSRCDRLCLLDAYYGYHQIHMHPGDEEKTSFITLFWTYY